MRYSLLSCLILLSCFCLVSSCQQKPEEPLFRLLPPEKTGVHFANTITENDSVNLLDYEYVYNGGGMAVIDVNNDGLPDLFFSGNMVPSRLYLNKGGLQFEDITESAGLLADNWATGVAVADVNNDGLPDLYVCSAGTYGEARRANLLYLNNGDNTFTESAQAYGVADTGFSTMAAFLDYNRDGHLDLYVLTYSNEKWDTNVIYPKVTDGSGKGTDRLYRNNGDGTFTNVSREAGILVEGYGLGVSVCDLNNDGWPDLYVSNDYVDDDFIFINNQDGTFTESAARYLRHISNFAMGNDVADFNNDGNADIMVVDMLPEEHERQKVFAGAKNYDKFMLTLERGYLPSYMRNTLQLNNGDGTFSEVGQLAGVHQTDWSWAPLLADLDNDGHKDLFISNGYPKDITNRDFSVYGSYSTSPNSNNPLPDNLAEQHRIMLQAIEGLSASKLQNYVFRNNGDLTFSKKSDSWGLRERSFSNGAAYADLDGDGDLDLIINNINDPAFIYENRADEVARHHFLRLRLVGDEQNGAGLGAKVSLYARDQGVQYLEHYPFRGFQSSVEGVLHFGLEKAVVVDSIYIRWPNGKHTQLRNVPADQVLTVKYQDATEPAPSSAPAPALFQEVSAALGINFRHQEMEHIDFKTEPLLPHKFSQSGPGLAVGDVNGDGLPDFYVGGAHQHAGHLYLQNPNGTFTGRPFATDQIYEDLGALFFDADGDGDLDLYVVSGGNEQMAETPYYQDRLYRNDGQGNFTRDPAALPRLMASGSCVVAADYDRDGDLDLFVGGRLHPGRYPLPGKSYLLRNDRGRFTDVTEAAGGKELQRAGMVTAALWTDFDQDGQQDLVLAGEWMPITFFRQEGGTFSNVTKSTGLASTTGWWNSLVSGDFDQDGDTDYVVGNVGQNSHFNPTPEEPVRVYAKDFDQNGSLDAVITHYVQGQEQPIHNRDEMTDQMNYLRKRFKRYVDYARGTFADKFTPEELKGAYVQKSQLFQSVYVENKANGKFAVKPLPVQAQFAPIFGMNALDVDGDGYLDLLAVGNSYATEVTIGRYDASVGAYLKGDGKGNFRPVPVTQSGFSVAGDAKGLASLTTAGGETLILVSQNAGPLRAFKQRESDPRQVVQLQMLDAWAEITLADGQKMKQELPYGSTYLSQSVRSLIVPARATAVTIYSYSGTSRQISLNIGTVAQAKE